MPDNRIDFEELDMVLAGDFTTHRGELENIDISSLSAEEIEKYSGLLEKYGSQMDTNLVDSLQGKVNDRRAELKKL